MIPALVPVSMTCLRSVIIFDQRSNHSQEVSAGSTPASLYDRGCAGIHHHR